MLNNCALSRNSATDGSGGGVYQSTLNNCTLSGNLAFNDGGGVYQATLNNCIVYYNVARRSGANYDLFSILNYCCTTPLPAGGAGNISAEPQLASATHLSAGSPCPGTRSPAHTTRVGIYGQGRGIPPPLRRD